MVTVGANIKNCREKLQMSQEDLALKIRIGTKTIDKYESGELLPTTQTLLKISTVLDVPTSELLAE